MGSEVSPQPLQQPPEGPPSPMQLGWVPLQVPSDWQNLRAEPTSTSGARQEKDTDER